MTPKTELRKPFREFAGQNGDHYPDVLMKIQKSRPDKFHINRAALLKSFICTALRGNWTMFVIGFVIWSPW